MTELNIMNMVCDRCITAVSRILREERYSPTEVTLGKAWVAEEASEVNMDRLEWRLREIGFELVFDKDMQVVTQIKAAVTTYFEILREDRVKKKMSVFVSEYVGRSYQNLSRLYSGKTGQTIEQFWIEIRIDRVKEMLKNKDLTLSEISWMLGYSSVQHLSAQFKKHTGMTVRKYKEAIP